jgi:hypothetical protein
MADSTAMHTSLLFSLLNTLRDVLPIILVIFGFQYFILRQRLHNFRKVLLGLLYVVIGLACFLVGLDKALFPLGEVMAKQLTDPMFIYGSVTKLSEVVRWSDYYWVYVFAAAIGFATTVAEPALIAVAIKASDVSGGAISVWGLRIAVAIGVAIGIALGAYRIITGTPLEYYIITGYVFVMIQTYYAPRSIIALAYDSGGVTTSTVTVPLVTALGIGLATTIPGRSALVDGFGLIAFASLFPMMTVMAYAQLARWRAQRAQLRNSNPDTGG